jgi:hypothetical protein
MPPVAHVRQALLAKNPHVGALKRYAPFLLLSPFFGRELDGKTQQQRHAHIRDEGNARFESLRPLYRFVGRDSIELHPAWADYIESNFAVVSGWAERKWIAFLQARNPLAPAVSEKISAPEERQRLTFQKSYWERIIVRARAESRPFHCIYSGAVLDPDDFQLDHFLPWSFVCHDSLWNLLPVLPAANASKHDRIPDAEYIGIFAWSQFEGLRHAERLLSRQEKKDIDASFHGELRMTSEERGSSQGVLNAYHRMLIPQMAIAQSIGFQGGWRYTTGQAPQSANGPPQGAQ